MPIRFDTCLGAAKKTPKRVPKQTSLKNEKAWHFETIRFDTPLGFAECNPKSV